MCALIGRKGAGLSTDVVLVLLIIEAFSSNAWLIEPPLTKLAVDPPHGVVEEMVEADQPNERDSGGEGALFGASAPPESLNTI